MNRVFYEVQTDKTPLGKALELYEGDIDKLISEREQIRAIGGTVVSTPEIELWGFPFSKQEAEFRQKFNMPVAIRKPVMNKDAWFVWLCTGSITHVLDHMPHPLPYIIFARDNRKLRVYSLSAIKRRLPKR